MAQSATQRPRVGVAAIISNGEGRVVFGRRKGIHGAGDWQFPGGHLEFGETYFECAEREALEETGLRVKAQKLITVTNDFFKESNLHYITLFVICERLDTDKEPEVLEPEKCEGWEWKSWEEIGAIHDAKGDNGQLFLPITHLLDHFGDVESLVRAI